MFQSFPLSSNAFTVGVGQIGFCMSGHCLAEGKDTNVPAVI